MKRAKKLWEWLRFCRRNIRQWLRESECRRTCHWWRQPEMQRQMFQLDVVFIAWTECKRCGRHMYVARTVSDRERMRHPESEYKAQDLTLAALERAMR